MPKTTVLLADDKEMPRTGLAQVLDEEGFEVVACKDGSEALRVLRNQPVDAIITDLRLPGIPGVELVDYARRLAPHAVIIVVTALGEVESAVEAMKKGACDYICKPLNFDEVIFRLKRQLASDEIEHENRALREQIRRSQGPCEMVGQSRVMQSIRETISRIAHTMSNVLICGESGTGKEVLARALHHGGVTRGRPFVPVDCRGLTLSLIESEFFGRRKGTFTGASADRVGSFETADGGTLFLDEIGNLAFNCQAALLRAIEEKVITRLGETHPRPVNIRVVAATNRDLERAIEAGTFREDLYYRLNVIRITVPPLRERLDDIPPLIDHFVRKYRSEIKCKCPGFNATAREAMCRYEWRGNVRELENVVERAVIFAGDRPVTVDDLSISPNRETPEIGATLDLRSATRGFERRHILRVLRQLDNNKVASAEALGIGLSSLYRKLEELEISKVMTPAAHSPQPSSSVST